jgi:hypothetical protein
MGKKILCMFVIAMLLSPNSAFAGTPSSQTEAGGAQLGLGRSGISPFFVSMTSLTYSLTFSKGNASCVVSANVPRSKADSVKFEVTLYKKVGTGWQSVKTWSKTESVASDNMAIFKQTKSVAGGTYKFTAKTTVYKDDAVVETFNYTTSEKSN